MDAIVTRTADNIDLDRWLESIEHRIEAHVNGLSRDGSIVCDQALAKPHGTFEDRGEVYHTAEIELTLKLKIKPGHHHQWWMESYLRSLGLFIKDMGMTR